MNKIKKKIQTTKRNKNISSKIKATKVTENKFSLYIPLANIFSSNKDPSLKL